MFEMIIPFETLLVLECVLDGEHPTPGMAEQEEVLGTQTQTQAQAQSHLLDLIDETINGPQ